MHHSLKIECKIVLRSLENNSTDLFWEREKGKKTFKTQYLFEDKVC